MSSKSTKPKTTRAKTSRAKTSRRSSSPSKPQTKSADAGENQNLFEAAAASAETSAGKQTSSKGTTLILPADADPKAHEAVEKFGVERARAKQAQDQADAAKHALQPVALDLICQHWIETGKLPKGIVLQNKLGKRLTYVLQDCTRGFEITAEKLEAIKQILGKQAAEFEKLLTTVRVFSFDSNVLAEKGVAAELSAAIAGSKLTPEQKASLIRCVTVTRIKDRILSQFPQLVGGGKAGQAKLAELIETLGGAAIKTYPKA